MALGAAFARASRGQIEGRMGNCAASRLERKHREFRDFPAPRCVLCGMTLTDKYGRQINDLRLSITDRCNYRCVYCRSGNNGPSFAELTLNDYLRISRVFVSLGITKIRLTGGEPLLRRDLLDLIRGLRALRTIDGRPLDLAITTNGHLLAELAQPLKDAGLDRITVSMDAVDPDLFARITRVPNGFEKVVAGIRAAKSVGLAPVKVNAVLLRGFNEDQIVPFAMFARDEGVVARFIEFMPLDEDRHWSPEIVVGLKEIVAKLNSYMPLRELDHGHSETARRYIFNDGRGEIGIIAPVTLPFCGACSRIRVTSDGKIRTCLFSVREHDLAGLILEGASDEALADRIRYAIANKEQRHHIGEPDFTPASRTMVHIGG